MKKYPWKMSHLEIRWHVRKIGMRWGFKTPELALSALGGSMAPFRGTSDEQLLLTYRTLLADQKRRLDSVGYMEEEKKERRERERVAKKRHLTLVTKPMCHGCGEMVRVTRVSKASDGRFVWRCDACGETMKR